MSMAARHSGLPQDLMGTCGWPTRTEPAGLLKGSRRRFHLLRQILLLQMERRSLYQPTSPADQTEISGLPLATMLAELLHRESSSSSSSAPFSPRGSRL